MRVDKDPTIRRIEAARAVGVGLLAVFAQYAVAAPESLFGPAGASTLGGAIYALLGLVGAALSAYGHLAGAGWAGGVSLVVYALHLGLFVPALESDPGVAGGFVSWLLLALTRQLFPLRSDARRARRLLGLEDPVERWSETTAPAVIQLAALALVLTAAVLAYGIGDGPPGLAAVVALDLLALAALAHGARLQLGQGLRGAIWALAPAALALPVALAAPWAALGLLGLALALSLALLVAARAATADLLRAVYERPALLIAASFVGLIGGGTLLLTLPAAAAGPKPVALVDALFTATSAACVTGLIVVDTPTAFSTFGHVVVIGLVQAGGLNIMVLTSFAAVILGRRLGMKTEQALGEILDLPAHRTASQLALFIVAATLGVEALGATVLAACYVSHGYGFGEALWLGVFHAISGFCNAGFALHSDSVVGLARDPVALLTLAALISTGGIGFTVIAWSWARLRGERRTSALPLQVKLVVGTSLALSLGGAAWYAVAEWFGSLAGLGVADKLVNALFQSVSFRTAGFNSVDLEQLRPGSSLVICLLMFVGGAPGGTAGGIKTTTVAVLLGAVLSAARGGRAPIVLEGRTIPAAIVHRAAATAVLAAGTLLLGAYLLLLTQDAPFEEVLFEACSAIGTTGLSLGATAKLDAFGKLVVSALMFAGRVGPLTLALLLGTTGEGRVRYPEARLMVG